MTVDERGKKSTEHDDEPDVEAHIFDGEDLGEPDPEKKRKRGNLDIQDGEDGELEVERAAASLAAWPPTLPLTEEEIDASTVGELVPHNATIELAEYDPSVAGALRREAERVRGVLGARGSSTRARRLDVRPGTRREAADRHGPWSSRDSSDEGAYVPALEAAGYVLTIREPDWYEHRLFKGPDTNVNLHTFSEGCFEVDRMLAFRDWLRTHDDDRELYESAKRELAAREWRTSRTTPTRSRSSSPRSTRERKPGSGDFQPAWMHAGAA